MASRLISSPSKSQSQTPHTKLAKLNARLFYGKEKYTVVSEKGEQPSVEPFLEIVLYLTGSCNIYTALDDIYDASGVEGLASTSQYRSIIDAPPILQSTLR